MKRIILSMFVALFASVSVYGQAIGIKTNVLMDATRTINIGAEIGLSRNKTLDLYLNYNPWTLGEHKMTKMLVFQPEYRLWLCERFNGHFFGLHAHAGIYQFAGVKIPLSGWTELENNRFKGHFYGAGISYGYQWLLSKYWNLEANIGVGYARVKYEKYECKNCPKKLDEGYKNYFGPTKAAVSLIYLF